MIETINKITPMHVLYVLGAGIGAGFVLVLLERYILSPLEQTVGVTQAGPLV